MRELGFSWSSPVSMCDERMKKSCPVCSVKLTACCIDLYESVRCESSHVEGAREAKSFSGSIASAGTTSLMSMPAIFTKCSANFSYFLASSSSRLRTKRQRDCQVCTTSALFCSPLVNLVFSVRPVPFLVVTQPRRRSYDV